MALQQMAPPFNMATKRPLVNKDSRVTFEANTEKPFRVMRGPTLYRLRFRLTGELVTPAVPAGTVRVNNPSELVREFRLHPRDMTHQISGALLHVLQNLRRKKASYFDGISTAEAAAVSTTTPFEMIWYLDLNEPGVEPQHVGCLPTALFNEDINGIIKWGAGVADLIDGAAAGTVIQNVAVDIDVDAVEHNDIPTIGYGSVMLHTIRPNDITVTNDEFKVPLKGGGDLHYVIIMTKTGANKNRSNAVLDSTKKMTVRSGEAIRAEGKVGMFRAMQKDLLTPSFNDDGIVIIPFVRNADDGGQKWAFESAHLPSGVDNYLLLPLVGAATNEIEILQVIEREPLENAAAWGLTGA